MNQTPNRFLPNLDTKCLWVITTTDQYKRPPNTSRYRCTKEKINGFPGYCEQHMKRWDTQQWKLLQRAANKARRNL